MPARTGAEFLRGLRDPREIWLGGQRVTDPMDHPHLRGAANPSPPSTTCTTSIPPTA